MTDRRDTAAATSPSGSGVPARRWTMADLGPAERLVVALSRMAVAGQTRDQLEKVASAVTTPKGGPGVVSRLYAMLEAMDDESGPEIGLRRVPCRHVGDDEMTILRLVAAVQREDRDSGELLAGCLVSPMRVDDLLNAAFPLADHLAWLGQTFRVTGAVEAVAIPGMDVPAAE